MNERIKELAEQAEKLQRDEVSYRERLHNRYCTGDMEAEIFREKFAELIVRECINEVHVADVGDLKAKGYYLDKVAEHLEKHFGIAAPETK